jgi:hypothetical protein
MLLNEFLKEHRKVQEQEVTIAELRTEIRATAALLKEQGSQIHRISERFERKKPTQKLTAEQSLKARQD